MKVFGKKNCKVCNGKGFMTVTPSAIHEHKEMVPCNCLRKVARLTIPHADMDNYETKVETINDIKTMFLTRKTVEVKDVVPVEKTVAPVVIPDVKPGIMPKPVIPVPSVKTVVEQPVIKKYSNTKKEIIS
jgi:hypothetical protein